MPVGVTHSRLSGMGTFGGEKQEGQAYYVDQIRFGRSFWPDNETIILSERAYVYSAIQMMQNVPEAGN